MNINVNSSSPSPTIEIISSQLKRKAKLMIDTGALVSLIKRAMIESWVKVNTNENVWLKEITDKLILASGVITVWINNITPVKMQVIEDDFPLVQDGLLGTKSLKDCRTTIDYITDTLTLDGQLIPFKVGYSNNVGNESEKVVKELNEIKQVISEKEKAHENDKNASELSKSCSTRSWQDGAATRLYEQNGSIDTHVDDKKQINTLEITESSKSGSSLVILAPQRIFFEENKDNSKVAEVNTSVASPCICKGKKADDTIENLRNDKKVAAIFEDNDFEMIESVKSEEKIEEIFNVIDPCDETYESYMIDTDDMNYCYERMLQIDSKFENTSERVYKGKDRVNKVLEALNLDKENSRDEIINLIKEYENVFHLKGEKLGTTDVIEHAIYTKDNAPVNAKPYRFPHALKCELERQIMEMWEAGTIEPSESPYRSNIFLVPNQQIKMYKQRTTNVVADCLSRNPIIESVNIVETRSRTIKTKPVNYKRTRTRNTKPIQLSEDKTSDVNDKEDKAVEVERGDVGQASSESKQNSTDEVVEVERGDAGQAITEPKQSVTDKEMTASEIVNTKSNTTLDPIIELKKSYINAE
ncbi:hypothetical protein TKK_0011364 [Trichogramma kaykai]